MPRAAAEQELFFVSGIVPPTTLYKLLRVMELARARDVKVLPVIPPGEAVVRRGRPPLVIEHDDTRANGKPARAKAKKSGKPRKAGARTTAEGEPAVMGLKAFIEGLFNDNPTIKFKRKELMQRAEKKGFRPRSVDGSLDQLRKAKVIRAFGNEQGVYELVPGQQA